MSPRLTAILAVSVRLSASSLARIELTWNLTVRSLMNRLSAISVLVKDDGT